MGSEVLSVVIAAADGRAASDDNANIETVAPLRADGPDGEWSGETRATPREDCGDAGREATTSLCSSSPSAPAASSQAASTGLPLPFSMVVVVVVVISGGLLTVAPFGCTCGLWLLSAWAAMRPSLRSPSSSACQTGSSVPVSARDDLEEHAEEDSEPGRFGSVAERERGAPDTGD